MHKKYNTWTRRRVILGSPRMRLSCFIFRGGVWVAPGGAQGAWDITTGMVLVFHAGDQG